MNINMIRQSSADGSDLQQFEYHIGEQVISPKDAIGRITQGYFYEDSGAYTITYDVELNDGTLLREVPQIELRKKVN